MLFSLIMFLPSAYIVGRLFAIAEKKHAFAVMSNKTTKMENNQFKYCRYYNGERECPFKSNLEHDYWVIEKAWVEHLGIQTDAIANSIIRFCNSPFHDITKKDELPMSLAAAILDYYEKKTEGMYHEDDFLRYYESYKKRSVRHSSSLRQQN